MVPPKIVNPQVGRGHPIRSLIWPSDRSLTSQPVVEVRSANMRKVAAVAESHVVYILSWKNPSRRSLQDWLGWNQYMPVASRSAHCFAVPVSLCPLDRLSGFLNHLLKDSSAFSRKSPNRLSRVTPNSRRS